MATGYRVLVKNKDGNPLQGVPVVPVNSSSGAEGTAVSTDSQGLSTFSGLTDAHYGFRLRNVKMDEATIFIVSVERPTFSDFTNAQHDHGDADDGGAVLASAIDHGSLSGLADDDHTQYATNTELSNHEADTSTHGVGEVVGRTEVQTLTNKTLTAPTIADFTNAGHDHGDADDGGSLVSGITLTQPTIADFTNANHDHLDADDGGTLSGYTTDAEFSAHESDTSTHGVGTVVGTSETQTLSNKAISATGTTIPAIVVPASVDTAGDGTTSGTTELTVREVTITNPAVAGQIFIVATVSLRGATVAADTFQVRLYFGTTPTQLSITVHAVHATDQRATITLHGTAAVAASGTQLIRTTVQRNAGTGTIIAAAGQCEVSWIIVPGAGTTA